MNKRYLTSLLLLLLALDVVLTYWQSYQFTLDGDMVGIVLPHPYFDGVMHDPFGWAVLTRNETYAATNRFFAHAAMGLYWKQVPLWLQHVVRPIDSLYAASALFSTGVHLGLLLLLAAYVRLGSGGARSNWHYWAAVVLLMPLLQSEGFYEQIGVINRATTYTFFYAFPAALLLLLLWPFFRAAYYQRPLRMRAWQLVLMVLLMVVVSFNGPITAAATAVFLLCVGLYWAAEQWRTKRNFLKEGLAMNWLSGQAMLLLGILALLSIYSLYIGRNNSENSHSRTLGELYQILPIGIYKELTLQWGLPLLLLLIIVNNLLIRYMVPASVERQRVLTSLRWVGIFSVIYLLLLPFGGYREYRPLLVRNDSILPVLLALFYAYGVSTYFLLFQLRARLRSSYVVGIVLFASVFMYVDAVFKISHNNDCERWALDQMARSKEEVVHLSRYCTVLTWMYMGDYNYANYHAEMLHYWRVTDRPKRYYQ